MYIEGAWSGQTGQGSGLTGHASSLTCQAGLTGHASSLTCQAGLTGHASSLTCQAGLTGRLAFGNPDSNVLTGSFYKVIIFSETVPIIYVYTYNQILNSGSTLVLRCHGLLCQLHNSYNSAYMHILNVHINPRSGKEMFHTSSMT